jgi:hypothetical protein
VDPKAGTSTVTLSQTTTYKLTAKNRVSEASATVTVTVDRPVVRIVRFLATPARIAPGQTSTLAWETENATEASIGGIGSVSPNGVTTVSPSATTTYTLTAKNEFGEVSATVTVTVDRPQVRIVRFTATPARIAPGESTTLAWETENATEASIGGIGSVSLNGSTAVSPSVTTTYTLTAKNQDGQVTATVTVEVVVVNHAPVADAGPNQTTMRVPVQLNGSASHDPDGDPITYSWRVAGAKPAMITGANTATPTVTPQQGYGDYIFELTVTDDKGARGTATTTVNYIDP